MWTHKILKKKTVIIIILFSFCTFRYTANISVRSSVVNLVTLRHALWHPCGGQRRPLTTVLYVLTVPKQFHLQAPPNSLSTMHREVDHIIITNADSAKLYDAPRCTSQKTAEFLDTWLSKKCLYTKIKTLLLFFFNLTSPL